MANVVKAQATDVAAYVPFGGQRVDLGEEAVAPAAEYPLLQYATGLPAQIIKVDEHGQPMIDEETGEIQVDNILYAGFFTEIGKDKELDAAMKLITRPIAIMHGNGEQKHHWMMQNPAVFLVAKGIPGNAASDGSLGIAYTWRKKRNSARSESVIYLQVIVRKLLTQNYVKPFILTLKSTQTVDCLNAIKKQLKVLQRAHEELQKAGNDMPLPLWSFSFHIANAKKPVMRGPEGGQQKQIFPMLASIPDEITTAYLKRHEIPLECVDALKDATEKSVEWAKGLTARIAAGVEPNEPWQQDTNNGMVTMEDQY